VVSLCFVLLALAAQVRPLGAHVVYLNHFNDGLDADHSAAQSAAKLVGGARLTSGGGGYPFKGEKPKEALDLGYSAPSIKAGVSYEVPMQDLRNGTIEFFIKTGFDWSERLRGAWSDKDPRASHSFISIPMKGGIWHGIHIGWYNRFGPWFNFHIYDGNRDYQVGLNADRPTIVGFDWRPGVWHYVVATWTPTSMRMFMDGKLAGELMPEVPLNLSPPDGPMTLGAGTERGRSLPPANAVIDELRICNRALYQGKDRIPMPERQLTLREEPEQRRVLAVGGPGTILYRSPRKTYIAPKFERKPVIDGSLSDAAWQLAPAVSGFTSIDLEHQYVPAQTTFRVGWDEENLYVAAECFEDPQLLPHLKADGTGRDCPAYLDDSIELFLAPQPQDRADYYQLAVNAGRGFFDSKGSNDPAWNAEWKRAVKRRKDRWVVEVAVPFKTLAADPPAHGTLWRFNVCRNRQVREGGRFSSWAELVGGFHRPEDFNKLLFQDGEVDRRGVEKELDGPFLELVREKVREFVAGKAQRELKAAALVVRQVQEDASLRAARRDLERRIGDLKAFLHKQEPDLAAHNVAYLGLEASQEAFRRLMDAVDRLGVAFAGAPPEGLSEGVRRSGDCWFLRSDEMTVAVSALTGIVSGIWEGDGDRLVLYSYERYQTETPTDISSSDEKQDEVIDARTDGRQLTLTCTHVMLPGVRFTKTYRLDEIAGQRRALTKEFAVQGQTKELTLISLTSKTAFDEDFLRDSYFDRIMTAGTMGDPRSVIPTASVKAPIKLRFVFNLETGWSNLCAVNTRKEMGLGQYFFTVDGRWVAPQGLRMSYFDEGGWRVGWFGTFVKPAGRSAQIRYHLFHGDRIHYHREVAALPERLAVVDAVPVSAVERRRRYEMCVAPDLGDGDPRYVRHHGYYWPGRPPIHIVPFVYDRLRSREHAGYYYFDYRDYRYGDYPTGDDAVLLPAGYRSNPPAIKAKDVRELVAKQKEMFPRVHNGWYKSPQSISKESRTIKEHPEWVLKDKKGRMVDSAWSSEYVDANWCPEFCDHLIERFCAEMDYYGMGIVYLDWDISCLLVDWENERVLYTPYFADWLGKLYREVGKRGGILWLNSTTSTGLYDVGYFEGWENYARWGGWRNAAEHMMMRRIYQRPGAKEIPLYWQSYGEKENYRDYANLVLSLCLPPATCRHDYREFKDHETGQTDWQALIGHELAYFDTTFEAADAVWADIGLQPAWWRDFETDVEAYALKQGGAYILTALRHGETRADHTLSADLQKMGFSPGRDLFVFQFHSRDPDKFPRRGGPLPQNWDRMFTNRTCKVIPAAHLKGRVSLEIPGLEPELVRMLALTQVPAVFCSQEGQETNLLLPTMLGGRIDGPFGRSDGGYSVKVSAPLPSEILLYMPGGSRGASARLDGASVEGKVEKLGEVSFLRVVMPKGESVVQLRQRH